MTQQKETPAALAGATGVNEKESVQVENIPETASDDKAIISWPSSFTLKEDGVYKVKMQDDKPVEAWVFSPLTIEARTCDANGQNWGLLLAVQSPDKRWHRWAMPMQLAGNNGSAYREMLLNLGLRMAPGAQNHLHTYLMTAQPKKMLRYVTTIGWHGKTYVLPNDSYGEKAGEIILQTAIADSPFRVRGTLAEWQEQIGKYCPGNPRLAFAVCAAFAAPLLHVCGLESGGVHFMGNSSIGKSLLLLVAGSVAGGGGSNGFLRRWRATDNAIESIALAHNDALLCLDEIGQLAPHVAAATSYMLANGQAKARATKDGLIRPTPEWRLLFLSNGELSLEQKIQEDKGRIMAGQAVRVLDIPADAGAGYGIFEHLHGFTDSKALWEHLHHASIRTYGSPLRVFLSRFTANIAENHREAVRLLGDFEQHLYTDKKDGQVNRAAKRFALFAAAGELAISFGVLPWETGTALNAAKTCFRDWVAFRGGVGAHEAREAVRRIRAFISANRTSRFEEWERDKGPEVIHNSAGFRREKDGVLEFMVTRDAFRNELCLGGNHKTIAAVLAQAEYLETDSQGNFMKTHNPPRLGKPTRFYTINGNILDADD